MPLPHCSIPSSKVFGSVQQLQHIVQEPQAQSLTPHNHVPKFPVKHAMQPRQQMQQRHVYPPHPELPPTLISFNKF